MRSELLGSADGRVVPGLGRVWGPRTCILAEDPGASDLVPPLDNVQALLW